MKNQELNEPSAREVSAQSEFVSAATAMLECLESIRRTEPQVIADHMPPGWGMYRLRDAFKLHENERQESAKEIVKELASAWAMTDWKQSGAREWQYTTITVKDQTLRVGASTGGVVSIDGYPFVPSTRQLCLEPHEVKQALQEHLSRKGVTA